MSDRRKGLLGKLKCLVEAIDDGSSAPCGPSCNTPCGPCYPCNPAPCQAPCLPCVQSPVPPCMPVCCPPAAGGCCGEPCCGPACGGGGGNCCGGDGEPCCGGMYGPPPVQACAPVPCPVPCPPLCVPMCPPCPPQCRPCVPCSPPSAMICFKRPGLGQPMMPVCRSKSRELLSSILYTGCHCEKRNGLQDDCPRSECRGRPCCLTRPYPCCGPSFFANGKHLGQNACGQCVEEYQCFPLCGPCPVPMTGPTCLPQCPSPCG